MHCHTNISDGALSPEEVKEIYRSKGYSAVCFTDHEVLIDQSHLCDENFVALHGYEIAIKKDPFHHTGAFMPVYHFNFIAEDQKNLKMPRFYLNNPSFPGNAKSWVDKCVYDQNDIIHEAKYDIEWINNYLDAINKGGFLVTYNHPCWSLQNATDYLGLKGLYAVEVMNGGCFDLGDVSAIHYQEILHETPSAMAVGGDDNHSRNDIGKAWTMIKAPELTYDALIKAYKSGDCYASCGPEIKELYVEDGKLYISTSPAAQILLRGEGRYVTRAYNCDSAVIKLDFNSIGKYFRLQVTDEKGKIALTHAYSTEGLI
jgi:hypothetical protein